MYSVLIVEDDKTLGKALEYSLEQEGYIVTHAQRGDEGLELAKLQQFSVIIMDISLPGMNGIQITKEIRKYNSKVGIITVTDYDERDNIIHSYNAGTNIYHQKPIDIELLKTQIQSMIDLNLPKSKIEIGDITFATGKRAVIRGEEEIQLTSKEYYALSTLVEAKGENVDRDTLIKKSRTSNYIETEPGSVDTLISRLRKKLGSRGKDEIIQTVHGAGYRINPELVD